MLTPFIYISMPYSYPSIMVSIAVCFWFSVFSYLPVPISFFAFSSKAALNTLPIRFLVRIYLLLKESGQVDYHGLSLLRSSVIHFLI